MGHRGICLHPQSTMMSTCPFYVFPWLKTSKFNVVDCLVQGLTCAHQGKNFYWHMGAIMAGCPSCHYQWLAGP